ncbi:MAG TPA: peptidylprolyl isomerase [Verrucomicrobiae bacterium]|nr:peptidylprolyl isomerase [Verrucomicrobiae bacterium]
MLLGCASAVGSSLVTGIQAVVDNSAITYLEVQEYTLPAEQTLQQQYQNQPEVYRQKLGQAVNESLEQLVDRQLMLHEFKEKGYNLPESIIDEEIQKRIHDRYGDRMTLIKTLQAQGMTLEKYRQQIRDQIIVDYLQSQNVSSAVIVSPHKIEVYYQAHTNQYRVGEEVKLRMIVLNKSAGDNGETHQLAEDILTKIKEGASFVQMASVYSQGSQKSEGGEWGWVEKDVLRKELADVAFTLKPGQRSGVIDTPGACYLMLVEDRHPAHIRSLSKVRDDIEKTLLAQERAHLQKQWIERLKKTTFIRYF